jgi:hypothetical protein
MLSPNNNLTDTQALLNLAAHITNVEIAEAYQGKSTTAADLKRILSIDTSKDTVQSALLKMMTFYFGANRVPAEPTQTEGSRIYGRAVNIIQGEVRIKPERKRVNGSPTGYYQINIPHFDPNKWQELRGYSHAWGRQILIYTFESKRQIKVNAFNEKEGHRMINHLLKAVDSKYLCGKSEKHSYKGDLAADRESPRLTGMKGRANRVAVAYPDRQTERHLL